MEENTIETKEDYIVDSLFKLFVYFVSLPPNKRTKKPSITLTQEQAIDIVRAINGIVAVMGVQFVIKQTEQGETVVEIESTDSIEEIESVEQENEVE